MDERAASRIVWTVLVLACASPAQAASACAPAAVIAAAERAQGGAIHSVRLAAKGYDFVVGQGWQPGGPWPKFNLERYERAVDLEAGASSLRTVRSQALHPPRGGARQPFEHSEEQVSAVAAGSPNAAAMRRELALLLPAGFIEAAARSTQTSARALAGGACAISITLDSGAPITAEVAADGVFRRIESKTADGVAGAVMGDVAVETRFTGRLHTGQWSLPAHIVQSVGGYPVLDIQITRATVNQPVTIAADITPPLLDWMAPAHMPSEQLGAGVFAIPGRYSAVAVDLGDHLAVIEGPQSEARALEIIAEAHRLIPGKPIRYVVNTHAHFDHVAGLRAFVAEGATIVTQEGNVAFLKDVLARPRTLHPDVLSRSPHAMTFLPVRDMLSLKGGGREIRLYRLENVGHTQGMLVAWLPQLRVLVEADVFTPPARARTAAPEHINPYHVQLLDNIERLGLDVQRLISIHYAADGRRVGMSELRLAAGHPQ